MNNSLSEAIKKVYHGENAQSILKVISASIWDRIQFARTRKGLKIFETTITQEILYQIRFAAAESNFNIKLFEAVSEKANGNDIECLIELDDGYLLLPIQAKIIYSNFKYKKIAHQVGSEEQIDLLLRYAQKKQGYPLYFLYNYHTDEELLNRIEEETKMDYNLFGVSYIDAFHLKDNYYQKRINRKGEKVWKIPSFEDLHPKVAKPFHYLLNEKGLASDGYNFIKENIATSNPKHKLKLYTTTEVMEDDDWIDLTPSPGIGRLPHQMMDNNFLKGNMTSNKNEFNPKFRLVLSSKKVQNLIRTIR